MKERVVQFGPEQMLVGIETLTEVGSARPAFIFLNAGVVYRVGPHRMTVNLARAVAEAGFRTLRFDLSGLGDSPPRGGTSRVENAIQDVRDAIGYLERNGGSQRFVLCGLCSGADLAWQVAVVDPRVVGIALLDPVAYPTLRTHLNWVVHRARAPGALKRVARRALAAMTAAGRNAAIAIRGGHPRVATDDAGGTAEPPPADNLSRPTPPRAEFARQLTKILEHARVYLIYSGAGPAEYNYPGQFAEAFGRYGLAERVRVEYLPTVNHTYTELSSQWLLGELLTVWAEESWTEASPNEELLESPKIPPSDPVRRLHVPSAASPATGSA